MPTQTYTPTASWNNTSSYQQNGDVSDATVLQLTGQDALDNLAYLTGLNTLDAVRRISTVADLAALKAITTHRDEDVIIIEGGAAYQFDSASAATSDDFAVVTPTAGGGRWKRMSAIPKSTTLRRVIPAVSMVYTHTTGGATGPDDANGRVTSNGGGTATLRGRITGLNAGDVITEIQLVGNANVAGGGNDIVATFYLYQADDGDTSTTVTTLGTLTIPAGTGASEQAATAAPLPITIPEGASHDCIHVVITNTSGAVTSNYIYWAAVNGTRASITE